MNTMFVFMYAAVIAVALAGTDHHQHKDKDGGKSGEVVQWSTGSNKGAATVTHPGSHAKQETVVKTTSTPLPTISPTTVEGATTAAEAGKAVDEAKPTDGQTTLPLTSTEATAATTAAAKDAKLKPAKKY